MIYYNKQIRFKKKNLKLRLAPQHLMQNNKVQIQKLVRYFMVIFYLTISYFANAQGSIVNLNVANYKLDVYLPSSYSENKTYPVVYFNDGQMLFQNGQTIALREKLDKLIANHQIEPVIVVGIYADFERTATYVPYNDAYIAQNDFLFEPKAKKYAKELTQKIIPFIDKKYSTNKTRNGRAIFGFSHGGLNATWLLFNYPKYFSMAAALSPSYWVANHQIFEEAKKFQPSSKIWFDIGTAEWNYYVPMIEPLLQVGAIYGKNVFYYEVPNGTHQASSWANRIHYPLLLFAGEEILQPRTMETLVEVIPSQSRKNVYFQRLNPIVTLSNGVKYSLANQAKYKLLNPEDGKIFKDGRFEFYTGKNLEVKVNYLNLENSLTIDFTAVEGQK